MEAAGPLAKNIGPGTDRGDPPTAWVWILATRHSSLAASRKAFEGVAGRARTVIGDELGLTDKDRFAFAWIVDFPIFQMDDETGKS